jgi:hypothetical protein
MEPGCQVCGVQVDAGDARSCTVCGMDPLCSQCGCECIYAAVVSDLTGYMYAEPHDPSCDMDEDCTCRI